MAIEKSERIWHNGKLIPWDDATIHVMSHVVHYGSSVFEGIRCYAPPSGPAIFRATEHIQRLLDSAKVYRIDVDYTREQLVKAMLETVGSNGVWPCYVRPIVLRGYGEAGVNPFNSPTEVYIINYPWGKYLGGENEPATHPGIQRPRCGDARDRQSRAQNNRGQQAGRLLGGRCVRVGLARLLPEEAGLDIRLPDGDGEQHGGQP